MAVSKIVVTIDSTSDGTDISISPSNYMDGIYDTGSLQLISEDSNITRQSFTLCKSNGTPVEGYLFPAGATTALKTAFPGYTLGGMKLEVGDILIPIIASTTSVGKPSNVKLDKTLARAENDPVTLSWSAGSAGTNNSVTGYDVQQRDSADGSTWGSWTTVSGSPVSGRSISVSPPDTVGHYRQFRVRTRGSAGSSYYSAYATSSNTLRRKWEKFSSWIEDPIIPRQTYIRAPIIIEIRERIDEIRAFYGLAAYAYTTLVARETKIAKWAVLIQELRDAVDEIGTVQGWNTLEAGKPRIAHITQLREIIDGL